MEPKGRPVVAQLHIVKERIRVIRKILNQSDQIKLKRSLDSNLQNGEEYDDESIYQAQKNLRDLINTLNSGKEDKYLDSVNSNDYNNEDYSDDYNEYFSSRDIHQDCKRKSKRQLATIAVQKTAFRHEHQEHPKRHCRSKHESRHHQFEDDYDDSVVFDDRNNERIFGLNNKKKKNLNFARLDYCHHHNQEYDPDYYEYSSSCYCCPNCSYKIPKRSKSPRGRSIPQTHKKRNASATRQIRNRNIMKFSTPSTSTTSNYILNDEFYSYDDDQMILEKEKNERSCHKNHHVKGSISSYDTNTSTLLNRYLSSPSSSLDYSTNSSMTYSSYDIDDSSLSYYIDDDDDIDVDEILHKLEKRRRYINSVNDSYLCSLIEKRKEERCKMANIGKNKSSLKNKKESQSSSKCLSMSSRPRYKFEDSINSSCSILSDLLDELSDDDEAQPLQKAKPRSQKSEKKQSLQKANSYQKQKKQKHAHNNVYDLSPTKNEVIFSPRSEEEEEKEQIILPPSTKQLNPIIQMSTNKAKQDVNQVNKVKHTVKFILEEEEEDILNNLKSSSDLNNKISSPLQKLHEEEEDVFLKSNVQFNHNEKQSFGEESLFELSSDNSEGVIALVKKDKPNPNNVSFEEEEEPDQEEEDNRLLSISSSKSNKSKEKKTSFYKEEESTYEHIIQTNRNKSSQNKITSSSLYNDADDGDVNIEEEEEDGSNVHPETKSQVQKNDLNSEEENFSIEMLQTGNEEEDNEIIMINHLVGDDEEESINEKFKYNDEEENIDEKFKSDEDMNIINSEDEDNQEEEEKQDVKSQHTLSDFMETGSVNIVDDDFE